MDQREPSMAARCSAELWGAPRDGKRREVTLVLLVHISHPCALACAHLVHWDSAPQFWSVPVHYDRKLSKGQENTVNTEPMNTEDPVSHSAWKRCSLTTQWGWCDTLFFAVHSGSDERLCPHQGGMGRDMQLGQREGAAQLPQRYCQNAKVWG